MRAVVGAILVGASFGVSVVAPAGQYDPLPSVRLVAAPRLTLPAVVDSNVPLVWELVDGAWRLFAFTSVNGMSSRLTGASLDRLQNGGAAALVPDPGDGVWIQSIVPDEHGTWYGFYHHERPADDCGRPDRFILRLGAARSRDQGRTWQDLGIIVEAARDTYACASPNLYVVGGVGDVSAMLTPDRSSRMGGSRRSRRPRDRVGRRHVGTLARGESRHAARARVEAMARRIDRRRRLLGAVGALEPLPRALRDAAQSRPG